MDRERAWLPVSDDSRETKMGRSAVQAYKISCSQLLAPRMSRGRAETHQLPVAVSTNTSRHLAVSVASILVEVLSRLL